MTDEERQRWSLELEAVKTQTALQFKQAKTEFWKIGIAALVAGAIFGGFVVSLVD